MRLSTKAQYAVRAMVSLNLLHEGSPVNLREIAQREDLSLSYLEQLFVMLRRNEIVRSVRGPGGGYVPARPAAEIRVDEIIDSVEETLVPVACMEKDGKCVCSEQCVTRSVWQGLGERIREFLGSITLEELTREARKKMEGISSNENLKS
ncbi:MAG: Rrf2 family transcriptional regulator [Deltaproteobacteria bacterium]|jgi:Rrf2 family iron-sulfur cluster assembly transcriptional regulator|nr:Rrf2 family transcriptional regulator [Deltaproteobacteria bacterium]